MTERYWKPPSYPESRDNRLYCGGICPSRHLDGAYWAAINSAFFSYTSVLHKKDISDHILTYINQMPLESSKNYYRNKFANYIID